MYIYMYTHTYTHAIYCICIFQLLAAVSRRWQQFQRAQTRPRGADSAELGAVGGAGCLAEIL